jgi:hypothetical protein
VPQIWGLKTPKRATFGHACSILSHPRLFETPWQHFCMGIKISRQFFIFKISTNQKTIQKLSFLIGCIDILQEKFSKC